MWVKTIEKSRSNIFLADNADYSAHEIQPPNCEGVLRIIGNLKQVDWVSAYLRLDTGCSRSHRLIISGQNKVLAIS